MNLLVRPAGANLVPSGHLALRAGAHSFLSSGDRHRCRPGVLGVHDHREAVVGDRQLDVARLRLLACLDLGRRDRAGRVRDDGFVTAELLKSAAGAGAADRHLRAGDLLLELLGDRLGHRKHGARPIDGDHRWRSCGRLRRRRCGALPLPHVAANAATNPIIATPEKVFIRSP